MTLHMPEQGTATETNQIASVPADNAEASNAVYLDIVDRVSPRYRKNVDILLKIMVHSRSTASWNDKDEFVYNGMPITGSHMIDLVRSLIQTRSVHESTKPKSYNDFMAAMAEINAPSSVLGYK